MYSDKVGQVLIFFFFPDVKKTQNKPQRQKLVKLLCR